MEEYFKLIRQALKEERLKGEGIYYEAHHIIPQSFEKISTTVLLTPEEHYLAHKYLAEYFKQHTVYGKKMLWAFHRLTYDNGRKLTEKQYGEARRLIQPLWKASKTSQHRSRISSAMKGNTNNSSRVFKGMKSSMTPQGRQIVSKLTSERQKGGKQWYGGPYTVEYESGKSITKLSYPDLSVATGIKLVTLQKRYTNNRGKFINGWKIK